MLIAPEQDDLSAIICALSPYHDQHSDICSELMNRFKLHWCSQSHRRSFSTDLQMCSELARSSATFSMVLTGMKWEKENDGTQGVVKTCSWGT
jgi:hypothetical protein